MLRMSCIDTWYRSTLRDTSRVVEYSALIPSQSSLNKFFFFKQNSSQQLKQQLHFCYCNSFVCVHMCVWGWVPVCHDVCEKASRLLVWGGHFSSIVWVLRMEFKSLGLAQVSLHYQQS